MAGTKSPQRKKIGRKGTMDQTVADGANFLANGTYDEEASGRKRALGKRKIVPVFTDKDEWVTDLEEQPKRKKQKTRSTSPAPRTQKVANKPKKAPASPSSKPKKPRSVSPKKTPSTNKKPSVKKVVQTPTKPISIPTKIPIVQQLKATNELSLPIVWEFKSGKPAFGVYVSLGKVWMANDAGDMYGFTMNGKLERHIKLPSGIKTIVADMGFWLYAGCDNGVVYDLSHETEPRIAYHFKETTFDQNQITEPLKDPIIDETETETAVIEEIELPKSRHIVFSIDTSDSMSGGRINAVVANLRMIYEHNIRDDDVISLIVFNYNSTVLLHRKQKGIPSEDQEIRNIIFGNALYQTRGCTAFWDSLVRSYNEFIENDDEEKWIIALTDGEDNESRSDADKITELASKSSANVIMVLVDDVSQTYRANLEKVCRATKEGLFIYVNPTTCTAAAGVTSAFKEIAQLLSSKIMWMDIRDGLLTVSDNKGRLCACSIEGIPLWKQQSIGNCGWMVRTDFEGVYHGHSKGITKYSPADGKLIWHKSLLDRVLFGWLDKRTNRLYVGAGNIVYIIQCDKANQVVSCICDATVSSTAATFGSEFIFAGDILGNIYSFDSTGKIIWKIKSNRGTPLSMHFHDDKLFIVTSDGSLLCVDVSSDSLTNALKGNSIQSKNAIIPEDIVVTKPITDLPETKDVGTGLVVEIYQQFTDSELLVIHNAIHDKSIDFFTVGGREYGIEIHANGCRYINIDGINYIEQNKTSKGNYAVMAQNGQKITWICNGRRWGLVVDGVVNNNGTPLLPRLLQNERGFDTTKPIQFPKNYRKNGAKYVVDDLAPSENDEFYRVKGSIKLLTK